MTVTLVGTAFPTTDLYQGRPFVRSDVDGGTYYYYDLANTQWVTKPIPLNMWEYSPLSANTTIRTRLNAGTYEIFLQYEISCSSYVFTTNDGANYWTMTLATADAVMANTTTIHTFDTSADTANTWTEHSDAPDSATPTNGESLILTCTKTGSPGNLLILVGSFYQFINT